MRMRREALVWTGALAVVLSANILAQNDRKPDDAQKREIQAAMKIVDDVAGGQAAANDLAISWLHDDVLKAQGNKQYVPFTINIDPSKITGSNVAVYWRVVSTDAAPEAPAGKNDKKDDKKDKDKKKTYAYEDVGFVPVTAGQSGPMRISRSFTVAGGQYDVFVVVKEPAPQKAPKNAPPPKMSVLKHQMTVPDFWNNELNTSSVIVAQRIDPLPAPLTPQQMTERPYALGTIEIVPAMDAKFTKLAELSTFLLIYNAKTDASNKPDVSVEFNFYAKQAGAEKFFNKTDPQNLNAQTLPPTFDFAAGHQLQSGQAVKLASFPEGDYRLEIKVTDRLANKTLTRDVNFTVTGS